MQNSMNKFYDSPEKYSKYTHTLPKIIHRTEISDLIKFLAREDVYLPNLKRTLEYVSGSIFIEPYHCSMQLFAKQRKSSDRFDTIKLTGFGYDRIPADVKEAKRRTNQVILDTIAKYLTKQ